jgi:hypothetical protein
MNSKSFSFDINEQAWTAWKNTINDRDKRLEDALREDLARITLDRANGELSESQRQACQRLIGRGREEPER